MEGKECTKCGLFYSFDMFPKNKNHKDGYFIYCKPCKHIMDKTYRENNPELNKLRHKQFYDNNRDKILSKTKEYNEQNKEKRKEYNKQNREKDKQYLLEYNSIHKHRIKPLRKEYNQTNKDKINEYQNNLYKNDINHKLSSLFRCRIYTAIKGITKRNKKAIEILGCSIDEFKQHLESLFLPEMNWQNHGEIWEIDHILPCSSFDFTKEGNIEKCFHYTNHQPLFKTTEIAESFGYTDQIGNKNKLNKLL
jgi:hypothetical protein